MVTFGYYSLYLASILTLLGILLLALGMLKKNGRLIESGKRVGLPVLLLVCFASLALIYALLGRDFSVEYVAQYTSSNLSPFYTLTAFWAGMAGSLLLWTLVLAIFLGFLFHENRRSKGSLTNWIYLISGLVFLFFVGMTTLLTNPLTRLPFKPIDGNGLNPMLRNIYMAIHPITLYLGYVGFSLPFIYAIAALGSGNIGIHWLKRAKKWTLLSWIFLTLGIFLGGLWAYLELGWGGYWAWDPVENASFIPWLTATALLHSMTLEEMRGMFRRWNFIVVFVTFAMTIVGTYITRSGVVSSVHAFASSPLSPFFVMYLVGWTLFGAILLAKRWKDLKGVKLSSMASREGFFLLNSWLLLGLAFSILFGVFLPVISEAVRGVKITVGPPFFNTISVPVFIVLLFLLGLCIYIPWRRFSFKIMRRGVIIPIVGSFIVALGLLFLGVHHRLALTAYALGAFVLFAAITDIARSARIHSKILNSGFFGALISLFRRNHRKYAGYIVHIGFAVVAIGITASSTFQLKQEVFLPKGESIEIGDFTVTYKGLESGHNQEMEWVKAKLILTRQPEKIVGILRPEMRRYWDWPEQNVEVDLVPLPEGDFYATLLGWDSDGTASFNLQFNPLVQWIWVGSIIMVIGALLALLPERREYKKTREESGA